MDGVQAPGRGKCNLKHRVAKSGSRLLIVA